MTISLYLVDDHAMFRSCLRQLLDQEADLRVVGEAGDGAQALAAARALAPAALADVVLIDVAMPGDSGIEVARQLCRLSPQTCLLALSLHDDPVFVRAMLAAGAQAYLLKSDPLERVLDAIRAAAPAQRGGDASA